MEVLCEFCSALHTLSLLLLLDILWALCLVTLFHSIQCNSRGWVVWFLKIKADY